MRPHGASHGRRPLLIGVARGAGAGQTTISRAILNHVGAGRSAYFQHDAYYRDLGHLALEERRRSNADHPDALEDVLLLEHRRSLLAGRPMAAPIYDFARYAPLPETRLVAPQPGILLEGILILANRDLRETMDIRGYVDADIRRVRRLPGDIVERGCSLGSIIDQVLQTVRPMHLEVVEPSQRYADVIVPTGGENVVALEMISARIERMLADANATEDR